MRYEIWLLGDADINDKIVAGARRREPEIDFLDAAEGGTRGLSDPEVLTLAAASGRVLVSSDTGTMPAHFKEFLKEHTSPGLIIVPQSVELGRAIEELIVIWRELPSLENQIRWVKRHR